MLVSMVARKPAKKAKTTSLSLTRNAEKVAKRAARDAAAEARALLDEIRDKQRTIASAFYDTRFTRRSGHTRM